MRNSLQKLWIVFGGENIISSNKTDPLIRNRAQSHILQTRGLPQFLD